MNRYPPVSLLQPEDLKKILQIGKEEGTTCYIGLSPYNHYIYPDKLVINSDYTDEMEYHLFIENNEIKMVTYLEEFGFPEYGLLNEEDEDYLNVALQLIAVKYFHEHRPAMADIKQFLTLVSAEEQKEKIPEIASNCIYLSVSEIGDTVLKYMLDAGQMTSFEWKEWAESGIEELNNLPLLINNNIEIPVPTPEEFTRVMNADLFDETMLMYFREKLSAFNFSFLAVGEYFDELQHFIVVPKSNIQDQKTMSLIAGRLGLIVL
ncbi:MAG: hypothetical protein ACRCU9_07670 [Iodobacter sp.]